MPNTNRTILTIFSVQFNSVKCTHIVGQPSIFRTFHHPQPKPYPVTMSAHALSRQPLATNVLLSVSVSLTIPHISGITQYLSFYVWLISLSKVSSSSTHAVACIRISFLFKT